MLVGNKFHKNVEGGRGCKKFFVHTRSKPPCSEFYISGQEKKLPVFIPVQKCTFAPDFSALIRVNQLPAKRVLLLQKAGIHFF